MPIDPTIALGFRSPAGSASSSQTSTFANLAQLMGLRDLLTGRLNRGQSLGGFMTGGNVTGDVNAGQGGVPMVSGGAAILPGPSTPPVPLPAVGPGGLMTGLSRYGENVHSTDGGKTWINSQTGQPVVGEIYSQTVI